MTNLTLWIEPSAGQAGREDNHRLTNRAGFSVIELVVVMAILVILTGITLTGLGREPGVQDVERAAFEWSLRLESAKARARALGSPVYWAVASANAEPFDAALNAYTFIETLSPSPSEPTWHRLPEDLVFATDPETGVTDLFEEPLVDQFGVSGSEERITGTVLVALAVYPDGSLRSGPDQEPVSATFRLVQGVTVDSVYPPRVLPPEGESDIELEVRVTIRPLTGVVTQEALL